MISFNGMKQGEGDRTSKVINRMGAGMVCAAMSVTPTLVQTFFSGLEQNAYDTETARRWLD